MTQIRYKFLRGMGKYITIKRNILQKGIGIGVDREKKNRVHSGS